VAGSGTGALAGDIAGPKVVIFEGLQVLGQSAAVFDNLVGKASIDGLSGAGPVAVTPDGKWVFAGGTTDSGVVVMRRDGNDLEFLELFTSENLLNPRSTVVTPDNKYLIVAAHFTDGTPLWVVMSIDPATGRLTYVSRLAPGGEYVRATSSRRTAGTSSA